MRLDVAWTIAGDLVIGDADDESAPMVTVKFHNEADREVETADGIAFWQRAIATMLTLAAPRESLGDPPKEFEL